MNKLVLLFLCWLLAPLSGCIAPQYVWPQKDLALTEINAPTMSRSILIASRESAFKQAVVEKIINAFRHREVYLKIIGIEALKHEAAETYSAVVIINTCMAWSIDHKVESFLSKQGQASSIIVLTTSDGGDIRAKTNGRGIDALSSASETEKIDPSADRIIEQLERMIE